MAWDVTPLVNNGYPYNDEFIGIISDIWTDGKHNYSLWRIDPDGEINDGYPYTYYMQQWLGEGGGGEEGDGDIIDTGGYRSNYPNGFTAPSLSQLHGDKTNMGASVSALGVILSATMNCYSCNYAGVAKLQQAFQNFSSSYAQLIQEIYGANLFNSVLSVKAFPFEIPSNTTSGLYTMQVAFGNNPGTTDPKPFIPASDFAYNIPSNMQIVLDFGTCDLNITVAQDIQNTDFKIYLPYAGLYSININTDNTLHLEAVVDLLDGTIIYTLHADDQIIFSASGNCSTEIPFNNSSAQMLQNKNIHYTNVMRDNINTATGGALDLQEKPQNAVISAQILSGNAGGALYRKPRIIWQRQYLYNNAIGYRQIYGTAHKRTHLDLSTLSGYVKTVGYKCSNIGLTAQEKAEIERLMDSGVIL